MSYDGWLSFGGNEVANTPRAVGISQSVDCPMFWLKGDYCRTLARALGDSPDPIYSEWTEDARNAIVNPAPASSTGWAGIGATQDFTSGHLVATSTYAGNGATNPRSQVVTAAGATPVTPGDPYYLRMEVKHSRGLPMETRPWFMLADGTYVVYHISPTANDTTDWTEIIATGTVPATAVLMGYQVIVKSNLVASEVGDVYEARNITTDPGEYFDGSTTAPDELTRYVWEGVPNASASLRETRVVLSAPWLYNAQRITDAPWYDPSNPDVSVRFYGVYVIDVDGLEDSTRQVQVTEGIDDGGVIGDTRKGVRNVRVRAVLVARGSDAMEYGRAWLEAALDPGACGQHGDECGMTDLAYFATCPPDRDDFDSDANWEAALDANRRYLHNVAVTSGPNTVQKMKSGPFYGRLVEFVFTAGRPWVYGMTRDVDLPTSASAVIQDTPFNLVPYPSAEIASADVLEVVARNYSTNPSLETNATGWANTVTTLSGTAPGALWSAARNNAFAWRGAWAYRGRLLGVASGSNIDGEARATLYHDIDLSAVPSGTPMSLYFWGRFGVVIGEAADPHRMRGYAQWMTAANAAVGAPIELGDYTANIDMIAGQVFSTVSRVKPATATKIRLAIDFEFLWNSGPTSTPSDIQVFMDAAAATVP